MKAVVTGGTGMLGKKLGKALLARSEITKIVLFDVVDPGDAPKDPRIEIVVGEVFDPATIAKLITPDTGAIFHLAGVVSAGAERDFDLGYRVNLDGTRIVLEAARRLPKPAKLVFASSLATYGGDLPEIIPDDFRLTPQTSYGIQKAMGEMLVADYTRKGYLDGRSLRLPTIVVRRCIEAFLRAYDLPSSDWGWNRSLMLPSLDVTVGEMAEGLKRHSGAKAFDLIEWKRDEMIAKIVAGWPKRLDSKRARKMGFQSDTSMDELIRNYVEDDMPKAA
jgi:nucleoside-diphosphate-sugar epimerase